MIDIESLDDLRWINRALADGEARIKEQREIIADHTSSALIGREPRVF